MTLVELLVGLVITAMALTFAAAAVGAAMDHRERVVAATSSLEEAVRVRRTLESWLSGARLSIDMPGPAYEGVDGEEGGDEDDELRFLTVAPTFLGTGTTVVRLYVDRQSDTPERGLVAELTEWRGQRQERVELAAAVTGLDVQYLSSLTEEQTWTSSWISTSVLPAALELRLDAEPTDSLPPLLRLPLLVALGSSR